jgi:hypothetical protein
MQTIATHLALAKLLVESPKESGVVVIVLFEDILPDRRGNR